MKLYRKLQRLSSKEELPRHFNTVVSTIERILGSSGYPDPADYSDGDLYAEKYLAYNLRRKETTPFGVKVDRPALVRKTIAGFLQQELKNHRLNQENTFGYNRETGEFFGDEVYLADYAYARVLLDARDYCHEILGPSPNLERILNRSDFGNGASATLSRKVAQRQRKFEHGLSATSGFLRDAAMLPSLSPMWSDLLYDPKGTYVVDPEGNTSLPTQALKGVMGGVFDVVDKTAEILRVIIKEPELNGFAQKGTGREIRWLLQQWRRVIPDGIDLNTSGDLNNGLAKAGSVHGLIATVDGERASDSITLAACEFFLPPDWYEWLCKIRSPYTVIPGDLLPSGSAKLVELGMMSGMGNGFTFELESLIFLAVGLACAKRSEIPFAEQMVSIHGDDLTIPADVMLLCTQAYQAFGVVVNESKSFAQGPFRESCGGHWFSGHCVKPFFVKTQTGTTRGDWFWLANSLLIWLSARSESYLSTAKGKDLLQVLAHLRRYAASNSRKYLTPFDRSRRSGIYSLAPCSTGSSYKCRHVVDIPRRARFTDAQAYVAWLHSPQVSPTVMQILTGETGQQDAYAFNEEVDERERWVRFNTWTTPTNGLSWPILWAFLDLHEGRVS